MNQHPTTPAATARFTGTPAADRAAASLPGHCDACVLLGHQSAHPELDCAAVGCAQAHNRTGAGLPLCADCRLPITGAWLSQRAGRRPAAVLAHRPERLCPGRGKAGHDGTVAAGARLAEPAERARGGGIAVPPGPTPPDPAPVLPAGPAAQEVLAYSDRVSAERREQFPDPEQIIERQTWPPEQSAALEELRAAYQAAAAAVRHHPVMARALEERCYYATEQALREKSAAPAPA
ncbi:hypothetical protein [Streptomyces sp. CB03911]|uniref:hypothetical protein n=1 Tax=Streptomyces sp. CB03911 TaxID=1804758 RepID=UPI00093B6DF7|nr:hypothetical protein [Streptomyces sp. CB03911]OKI25153.1 hypothetical protein A6A07_31680 [Streptomyces sp. CB03911]